MAEANSDSAIRCLIKEYRRRKGLSQDELARLVGVRRQAVYDMESGRYLPNTGVALRLARVLGCTVETLFVEDAAGDIGGVHLLGEAEPAARLALAQVRGKTVGVPLGGTRTMPFRLSAADGLLSADNSVDCLLPPARLAGTLLVLGCDPALDILGAAATRSAPGIRAHTVFASSRKALVALAEGHAHIAATHFHGSGSSGGNIEALRSLVPNMDCVVVAFSRQEEGLMAAAGNPLGIRGVEDIAGGRARFVNREEGAALRRLLDTQLEQRGIPASAVSGYDCEVRSHSEGAMCVASGAADAALGLRVVAEAFGLAFVPLAETRCDLVIPSDLKDHTGVAVFLDMLQASSLRKELAALAGYDASDTGKIILGGK